MRILIAACLLVVATSSSVAPTSQRLRDRYGDPDAPTHRASKWREQRLVLRGDLLRFVAW